jgi:hypothetical protein
MTDQSNSSKRNQKNRQKQEQQNQPDVTQVPDIDLDENIADPDEDQYGNLDEPDLDLYGDLDKRESVRDADQDVEAQDQYGSQNPIGSQNEPGTPGGEGLYNVQDQYGQDKDLVVQPGSDQDQYRTRGSQDQYGYQQNIE